MTIPAEHIEDSLKLEADGYVSLYQIILPEGAGTLYLTHNHDKTWQGNSYEGTFINISGVASFADEEASRPSLTILNPMNIFHSLVNQGALDNAKVVRIRVLKEHYENNVNIFRKQQWRISRVASLVEPNIVVELRNMMDGQMFMTPARMYIPPEFPAVSLT